MARTTKGNIYQRGKSKNYYAVYTVNGTTFRRLLRDKDGKPTSNKTAAKKLLHDLLNPLQLKYKKDTVQQIAHNIDDLEKQIEQAKEKLEPVLKIANAWEVYKNSLKRKDCAERTLQGYKMYFSIFQKWLADNHPNIVYMQDMTQEIAGEYAQSIIKAKKSANTFNKHIGFLKLIFRTLEDQIKIGINPFKSIERRQQNTQSRRELTIFELKHLLDSASGDLYLLLLIGATTGLRLGDCCTLKWSEVDLVRQVIRRVPNKTARRKAEKQVVIGIPNQLLNALSMCSEKNGYIIPSMAERYNVLKLRSTITRRIQRHFEKCSIQCHREGTGPGTGKRAVVEVGFHSLRHTYVSIHAERGTPAAIIQGNVGHGSPAMTAHYTHISDKAAVNVAKVLEFDQSTEEDREMSQKREKLYKLIDMLSDEKVGAVIKILEDQLK